MKFKTPEKLRSLLLEVYFPLKTRKFGDKKFLY